MNPKYLPHYYKWMRTGRLDNWGLCGCFPKDKLLALFDRDEGKGVSYWGFEDDEPIQNWDLMHHKFTTLRQTIVLFMAAMNNEL